MKLGKRLKHLQGLVAPGYTHIWDCCCDHGLLGAALLKSSQSPHIHFVDNTPTIMDELERRLVQFFSKQNSRQNQGNSQETSSWHAHCIDASTLPISSYPGKHLVIIAGVGGMLTTKLCKTIVELNPHSQIDFLLCPVHDQYHLRKNLSTLGFALMHESLIEENRRVYEALFVSRNANDKISPAGDHLWQVSSACEQKIAAKYLQAKIKHYQKLSQNEANASEILKAYKAIQHR